MSTNQVKVKSRRMKCDEDENETANGDNHFITATPQLIYHRNVGMLAALGGAACLVEIRYKLLRVGLGWTDGTDRDSRNPWFCQLLTCYEN